MIYKTLALKLHKPGKSKAQLIDNAMISYAIALEFLLANLKKTVERQQSADISKTLMERLNAFNVEPFKDALRQDAKAIITGYLARKKAGNTVSYPRVYIDDYQSGKLIDRLFAKYNEYEISKKKLDHELNKVLAKSGKSKTLFFCRNATNRDFAILYNPVTKRYYAKIYLLNYANAIPNPHPPKDSSPSALIYLSSKQEAFKGSGKKIRYLIVPLEFGKWQEQYLQRALAEEGVIKTARLLKKGGEYYLYVNLQLKTAPQNQCHNFIGIMPSGSQSVDYIICNHDKQVIKDGELTSSGCNQDQASSNLASEIVALAKASGSQLVVYNPKIKSDLPVTVVKWHMNIDEYTTLLAKIRQRVGEEGLPEPIKVSSRGLYTTCPNCQNNSKKNLITDKLFICNKCGHSALIHKLGVFNLASRLLTYESKSLAFHSAKHKDKIIISNEKLGVKFATNADYLYFKRFVAFLEAEKNFGVKVLAGKERYEGVDYKQKYVLWRKLISLDSIEANVIIEN